MEIAAFTPDQARRLLRALDRLEADERSEGAVSSPRRPAEPVQLLKITGAASGGLYPAKLSWWNDATATETLSDEVRWKPRNGAAPAVNDYVLGRYTGPTAAGTHGLYVGLFGGGAGLYTGTQTIVTGWDSGTCTATTKTMTVANGLITGIA